MPCLFAMLSQSKIVGINAMILAKDWILTYKNHDIFCRRTFIFFSKILTTSDTLSITVITE